MCKIEKLTDSKKHSASFGKRGQVGGVTHSDGADFHTHLWFSDSVADQKLCCVWPQMRHGSWLPCFQCPVHAVCAGDMRSSEVSLFFRSVGQCWKVSRAVRTVLRDELAVTFSQPLLPLRAVGPDASRVF